MGCTLSILNKNLGCHKNERSALEIVCFYFVSEKVK